MPIGKENRLKGEPGMLEVRYVDNSDAPFWFRLDRHLSEAEFCDKVRTKRGYVVLHNEMSIGLLRYNLFWDNTPFCNLLIIDREYQRRGCGKHLLKYWESDMKEQGYGMLLTSTRVDETAQHFYRKQGYQDCGGLIVDVPKYAQPMELFFIKLI